MSSRCLVFICLVIAVQSALIKKRNIPVEIVYDKYHPTHYGNRNLGEKVQLSHDDLLKLKISDEIINAEKQALVEAEDRPLGNPYGVKNLEEKVQLSPEELGQASKHLPNVIDDDELVKSALADAVQAPAPMNTLSLLKKAEAIIYGGLNKIRNNIDKAAEGGNVMKPSQEDWEKFNQTVEAFFKDQYRNVNVKQEEKPPENNQNQNNQNQNIIQNIINNFQTAATNFMQNYFPQNNQQAAGPEDEQQQQAQQQGPFQQFVNMFSGGFNQIVSSINNLNGQNNAQNGTSGQEDTGNPVNQGSNFFNNVINQVQQFFSRPNQGGSSQSGGSSQAGGNQEDAGTQPSTSPPGLLQGAFNQFNNVVNNLRPPITQAPVQGDEGTGTTTTQRGPIQIIQSIGSQLVGNFLGQQSSSKPPEDEGAATTQSTNFIQNLGQAFQNVNIFRPQTSTQKPGGAAGSNPISSGAQTIQNQLQQLAGGQAGGNPVETIQNAISGGATTEKNKDENSQKNDANDEKESEGKKVTSEVMEATE
ncbi:glutenin, high molecular weight subunit DX5-like [Asbolus verrucosus]|uniref:Glutenin, high molecular weight subunit DX5-like n=1 Tax=Asbolus verrucosus TaxID=1661398 RepID=A0A482VW64_ASBVE|nr:glutenin, high molecular weight subunit DX5-like [Asbolus verrucosus]